VFQKFIYIDIFFTEKWFPALLSKLNINEDFHGGYLNFLHEDLMIKPKKLSLVLFDSKEVHRITEVLSGVRIAMPIWATNIKEKEVSYEL
jgi:predicted 2-oxoglutarate/Fe(II)-dependent dioxygenase YbiX